MGGNPWRREGWRSKTAGLGTGRGAAEALLGVPCVTGGRVGTVGCSKAQRTHLGSPRCRFPVGLLLSHHGKAPSSHAARGKGL